MSYSVRTLESSRGETLDDQFYLLNAWKERQEFIAALLDESLDEDPTGQSPLEYAVRIADRVPAGELSATVYSRERRDWTEDSYVEMGILLTSDVPGEPSEYVGMCMPVGDEYVPLTDIDPSYAGVVGELAMRQVEWAALRGVTVTPDMTSLVMPELSSTIQTA
jgi:hypothetical protein